MRTSESIQVRLRRIILLTSTAVLLLATSSFVAYEVVAFRRSHKEIVTTLGEVVAQNISSFVAFDDPEETTRFLASLAAEPTIYAAAAYNVGGRLLARYARQGVTSNFPPHPGPDRVAYEGDRLIAVLPIHEDRRLGTLYLQAGLDPLYERLRLYSVLAALILSSSLGLAYFLSAWLQQRVTVPLLDLARVASRVSKTRDYSLRASKRTEDEIGGLTEAFNEMLAEIGRREQAVLQSSERLQLALEASRTGTWDWDILTDTINWDDHLHALFGLSPGEFSGSPADFFARVDPEDRPGLERIIRRAQEKKREFYAEYRVSWPDGSVHYMVSRGRALADSTGRPIRTTGVTIDVTESKRAEQALRESEERFRTMADAAPVLIWTSSIDFGREYFNKSWLDFTGRSFQEQTGQGWAELMHPDEREECLAKFKAAFESRTYFEHEYRLLRHDGQYRAMRDVGSPRFAAGGTFRGFIGSCLDITDIRQAQVELESRVEERTAELAETNRELEAFTYSVSHDLRAPLRHINSYAQVLEEDFAESLNGEAREYLRRIRAGAYNMGVLVDDMLNLARVGRQDLTVTPCPLNLLVEEVTREISADAPTRKIEWKIEDLGEVECDAGLVKQVFVNLISNAAKYTRPRENAVIQIGCRHLNGEKIYFVKDNGVGFDMKYSDKLFGVFQRLHRADEFEGTGVGLALVDRIVRKHGGRIWADAAPNKGATFSFTLGRSPRQHS